MNNIFFALSNLAGVIPPSRVGTSRPAKKTINLFSKETQLKNLPALKSVYQTAFELHRRIVESRSLVSSSKEKIHNLSQAVETARKNFEIVTGDYLVGAASAADQTSAQSKLDAAIADHDGATREAEILLGAIRRLSINSINAKVDMENHTNAALSEITQAREVSIKENEKLRQMLLDIHCAGVLAEHVRCGGLCS